MSQKKISREEVARNQIGSTTISRALSQVLTIVFLCVIVIVPVSQYWLDSSAGINTFVPIEKTHGTIDGIISPATIKKNNNWILNNIDALENSLEDNSFLRKMFLGPMQYFLLKFLGQGNDKVVLGKDNWIFYRQGVDYLTGPPFLGNDQLDLRSASGELWEEPVQPDPVLAILDFKKQLEARGIELVLLPVPVKPAILPGHLTARSIVAPLSNRSWEEFLTRMRHNGVRLFNCRQILWDYSKQQERGFLQTDTHWSPEAMQRVATGLAAYLKKNISGTAGETTFVGRDIDVDGTGDIAKMLDLPPGREIYPVEKVTARQIMSEQNELWQPDRESQILILGDSFTNIYSVPGLGWGYGAGFAEQLSYEMRRAVDLLARNDSGAYVTREMLATELARGRDRLDGKKVVVWEFAERELSFGDWKLLDLKLGIARESSFFLAEEAEKIHVSGTVKAISVSPKPGSVPYRDNILTVHLVDIEGNTLEGNSGQAVVYGMGMHDNQLTRLATLRPGDVASFTISSWEQVETEYGSYRRTMLEDEMLELELPNWGELNDD